MNRWTCVLLVLLRLTIGWHFFFEGLNKIRSHAIGETLTNKPWTSEGFFREAYGPAGPYFRNFLGDPDVQLLAKLSSPEAALGTPVPALPTALGEEWDQLLDRFSQKYNVTEAQKQQAVAQIAGAKAESLKWLQSAKKTIKKTFPSGVVEVEQTTPVRVAEFARKLDEIRAAYDTKLPAFGKDVEKANLRTLKADAAKMNSELQEDLDQQYAKAKTDLLKLLDEEQSKKGPFTDPPAKQTLARLDLFTMWFLCILGSCLLLGVFTRTACLGLASFLLLINLSAPALPYAPTPPGAVGYYLFVNLYVIELVALLLLATTRSGQWLGIDAIIEYCFGGKKKQPAPKLTLQPTH